MRHQRCHKGTSLIRPSYSARRCMPRAMRQMLFWLIAGPFVGNCRPHPGVQNFQQNFFHYRYKEITQPGGEKFPRYQERHESRTLQHHCTKGECDLQALVVECAIFIASALASQFKDGYKKNCPPRGWEVSRFRSDMRAVLLRSRCSIIARKANAICKRWLSSALASQFHKDGFVAPVQVLSRFETEQLREGES